MWLRRVQGPLPPVHARAIALELNVVIGLARRGLCAPSTFLGVSTLTTLAKGPLCLRPARRLAARATARALRMNREAAL